MEFFFCVCVKFLMSQNLFHFPDGQGLEWHADRLSGEITAMKREEKEQLKSVKSFIGTVKLNNQ